MKRLLALVGMLLLLAGAFVAFKMFQPLPENLNLATTRPTVAGQFEVTLSPENADYQRNALHSWVVLVTTPGGKPVDGAEILVDGGMPQHGHGLPTSPHMTEALGEGRYKIEGVRFNMRGWWEFKLAITSNDMSDNITFNLVME